MKITNITWRISVPYRGVTFLNNVVSLFCMSILYLISVPYRGVTFLNESMKFSMSCLTLFPSPIGELHFSMEKIFIDKLGEFKNFRPLSGSYISQLYERLYERNCSRFPSPIGELHFSIPSLQSRFQSGANKGIAWQKKFLRNVAVSGNINYFKSRI